MQFAPFSRSPKYSRGIALRANILPCSHFAYARTLAKIARGVYPDFMSGLAGKIPLRGTSPFGQWAKYKTIISLRVSCAILARIVILWYNTGIT